MVADLLAQGLGAASDVVVSGCSAGGLATYLHVDRWAAALPKAKVRGLPDSGFFLDFDRVPSPNYHAERDTTGEMHFPLLVFSELFTLSLLAEAALRSGFRPPERSPSLRAASVSSESGLLTMKNPKIRRI